MSLSLRTSSTINLNLKLRRISIFLEPHSFLVSSFALFPFSGQRNIGKFNGLAQQEEALEPPSISIEHSLNA